MQEAVGQDAGSMVRAGGGGGGRGGLAAGGACGRAPHPWHPHSPFLRSTPPLTHRQEEIIERVQQAVADGRVESVVLTVGTQVGGWVAW